MSAGFLSVSRPLPPTPSHRISRCVAVACPSDSPAASLLVCLAPAVSRCLAAPHLPRPPHTPAPAPAAAAAAATCASPSYASSSSLLRLAPEVSLHTLPPASAARLPSARPRRQPVRSLEQLLRTLCRCAGRRGALGPHALLPDPVTSPHSPCEPLCAHSTSTANHRPWPAARVHGAASKSRPSIFSPLPVPGCWRPR